jgi:hypothetical protein
MSKKEKKFEDVKFPVVRNIQPILASDIIEGIPTEYMPKRMNEMYRSVFSHAVETINRELDKIRNVEGKEDRVKYLEELLVAWHKPNKY